MSERRKVDAAAATRAFQHAIDTHTQELGQFFLARLLGLQLRYDADSCRVDFEVQDFMLNPQGKLHGGVVALVMDVSMGHLLAHLQGMGLTLEMKTQYLRAVQEGPARVVGTVLKRGASVWFLQSQFFDADGELAAFSTSTWKLLKAAPGASASSKSTA